MTQSSKSVPNVADELYKSGQKFLSQGDLQGAQKAFRRVLSKKPLFIPALFGKAQALYQEGQYSAGAVAYRKIIEQDSTFTGAWLGYIRSLDKLRQKDKALDACDEALTNIRVRGEILYLKGNILLSLKDYMAAMIAFTNAKQEGYSSKDLDQKISLIQSKIYPSTPTTSPSRKTQKSRKPRKSHRRAVVYNTSSSIYPSMPKTHPIGQTPQKLKRYISNQPSSHSPEALSHIPSLLERGEALLRYQYYREAQAAFEQLLQEEPHNAHAYHGLGCTLRALGEEEESLNAFRKAEKYRSSQDTY